MDLFFSRNSGNSSRSVLALVESGVPWNRCPVDPHAGETRSAEYLAKNPMGKVPALAQAAEAGRKELGRYLPVLESALAGGAWLETEFSLADIAYAPHFMLVAETGFDFSPTPALRAWLDRLLARPAWQETRQLIFG
jgi:glutathione S-transferase